MLPKNLKYGNKVESQMARSYKSNISPQNGTGPYLLGDTIILNLPTANNTVLVPTESYFKFNIAINNTSGANNSYRWEACGAHSIISRIRIFHGSNLVQDISEYGLLAKLLFDVQVPFDAIYGKNNILCGTRSDLTLTTPVVGAVADISQKVLSAFNTNSGDLIGSAIANGASTTVKTYCLNLISLVGTLCSTNYLPLFAMTSAPLRVEITLVDQIQKAFCATSNASTISVTNVEYVGNFISLNDQAVGMIYSSLQGQPLQFVVPDYRNYQFNQTLTNGTASQINFGIPSKFSSLKSIFATIRDQGTGNATYFPCSSVSKGISDYYFRVGSQIMPLKNPSTLPEMFSELLKAVGSMSDLNHHPAIDNYTYTLVNSEQNGDTVINKNSGSFYIGLDLESYANSDKSSIFQGYNSNTDDIFLVINFSGAGATNNCRFDAFALFDSVVVFENNTAYVKF
jgi:hypothetical protein